MKNKVEESTIDDIMSKTKFLDEVAFNKVTIVHAQLPNGFVIVESSGAVSAENFDFEIGKEICMKRIKDKIWELEGYKLASELAGKE